jgi:hypothetical protein
MHRASSHGNGHFLLTALIFGAKSAGSEQHEISPMNIKPYKTTRSNNKKLMLIAALPTMVARSVFAELDNNRRTCGDGWISKIQSSANHLTIRSGGGLIATNLPSNPLSLKKRVDLKSYAIAQGDYISYCKIEYLGGSMVTSLQKDGRSIVSEQEAIRKIPDAMDFISIGLLNIFCYPFLFIYLYKLNKGK